MVGVSADFDADAGRGLQVAGQTPGHQQVQQRGQRAALTHPSLPHRWTRGNPIDHHHRPGVSQQKLQPGDACPRTNRTHHGKEELPVDGVERLDNVEQGHRPPPAHQQEQHQKPDAVPDVAAGQESRLLLSNGAAEDRRPPVSEDFGQEFIVGVEQGKGPVVAHHSGVTSLEQSGDPPIQKPSWDALRPPDGCVQAGEEALQRAARALLRREALLGRIRQLPHPGRQAIRTWS
jgi:hypothetical protein